MILQWILLWKTMIIRMTRITIGILISLIMAGYLHSNLTDKNYYEWISEDGPFFTYHDNSMLIESVGFVRIGGEKLKFSVKLGGTWIYKFTNTGKSFPYFFLNLGIGINYRF